jgi:hypothetical protein
MTDVDKVLQNAALNLDLIARLIDNGAPLDSSLKQLREVNNSLDDVFFSDLTDEQAYELARLYSIKTALEKGAFEARRHGRYAYFWENDPKYGWVIVKFT